MNINLKSSTMSSSCNLRPAAVCLLPNWVFVIDQKNPHSQFIKVSGWKWKQFLNSALWVIRILISSGDQKTRRKNTGTFTSKPHHFQCVSDVHFPQYRSLLLGTTLWKISQPLLSYCSVDNILQTSCVNNFFFFFFFFFFF